MKNKKNIMFLFIFIFVLIGFILKTSFSYFNNSNNLSSNTNFNANFSCLNMDFTKDVNDTDLKYFYPIKDSDVFDKVEPIMITIKNNCDIDTSYSLILTSLKENNNQDKYLKDSEMKIMVMNNNENVVNSNYLDNLNIINEGKSYNYLLKKYDNDENKMFSIKNFYEIKSSVIEKNTDKEFNIYLWIDYYEGDKSKSGILNNTTKNKIFKYQLDIIENI